MPVTFGVWQFLFFFFSIPCFLFFCTTYWRQKIDRCGEKQSKKIENERKNCQLVFLFFQNTYRPYVVLVVESSFRSSQGQAQRLAFSTFLRFAVRRKVNVSFRLADNCAFFSHNFCSLFLTFIPLSTCGLPQLFIFRGNGLQMLYVVLRVKRKVNFSGCMGNKIIIHTTKAHVA